MKINLVYGDGEVYNGYLNLNPFVETETENIKRCDIKNIKDFVDDGEADELIAIGVLEYLNSSKIPEILGGWINKVKIGGKIIIGFVDSNEAAKNLASGLISIEIFNSIMHGDGSKPYMIKRTCITTSVIKSLLSRMGLKVIQHKINNYNVTVEAMRNG